MNDKQFLDLAINTLEKMDEDSFNYSRVFDKEDIHDKDCKRCILGQMVLDNNLNTPELVNAVGCYLPINKEFFDKVSDQMFGAVVLGEFGEYGVEELHKHQEYYSKQEVLECLYEIKNNL